MPPLPSPVSSMATVRRDNTMLLIGGIDDKKAISNEIIQYDYKTGKSDVLMVMKTKLAGCAALYLGNALMMIGGAQGGAVGFQDAINEVDCYKFSSRSWKKLPSIIRERYFPSAVIVKKDFEF